MSRQKTKFCHDRMPMRFRPVNGTIMALAVGTVYSQGTGITRNPPYHADNAPYRSAVSGKILRL
jgi:hypothetical protein